MIIMSVQWRKPDAGQRVLIWVQRQTDGFWTIGSFNGREWESPEDIEGADVTHWMELPGATKQGVLGYTEYQHPPYDGRPCPMCPMEIRNLSAVAHNLLAQLDRGASSCKLEETLDSLRRAVESVRPYSEAHFADQYHSHGTREPQIPHEPKISFAGKR